MSRAPVESQGAPGTEKSPGTTDSSGFCDPGRTRGGSGVPDPLALSGSPVTLVLSGVLGVVLLYIY